LFLLVLCAAGCDPSPSEVVESAFETASGGDLEAFSAWFTEDSRALLVGFGVYAERGHGAFSLPKGASPPTIVGESIEPRAFTERDERGERTAHDLALVSIESRGRRLQVPLIVERGRWRIHLPAMGDEWRLQGR
jgi:hypothetical protein